MSRQTDVLLLTRNLPPLIGGMERLITHICEELSAEWNVEVIGPSGCGDHMASAVQTTEIPASPMARFFGAALMASVSRARRGRPSVVFAGSGLTAPIVWLAARLYGASCVVYLHGMDIELKHPVYRLLWHPFLRRFDRIIANSRFTRRVAENVALPGDRIEILCPGVSLPDLSVADTRRSAFRNRYDLGDAAVLLYVGRITKRKGLDVFVDRILPGIIKGCPQAKLVVIGEEPDLALNRGEDIRATIERALAAHGTQDAAIFLGSRAQDDLEISEAYFAADVHVFPVQDRPGDNEGFGMVAVEAAAHGLPTVAFDAGGVGDAVDAGESGQLVNTGDTDGFVDAVLRELRSGRRGPSPACRRFAEQFAWTSFGERLRRLVRPLMPDPPA